jgi:Flp pilus assembly protein TadG
MNQLSSINTVVIGALPTAKCLKSILSRRGSKNIRAQTTVEFALICLPFFIILFAIVDYAQIYFYKNSLQNALREATRFATAGRIIQAVDAGGNPITTNVAGVSVPVAISDGSGREASRNECIRWWFLSNCVIQIPLTNITITSAPTFAGVPPAVSADGARLQIYNATNTPQMGAANDGPGAANDYVQVTAVYRLHTITPMFNYLGGYSHGNVNTYRVVATAIVKNEPALLNFKHNAVYSDEYGPRVYPDDTNYP